MKTKVLSVFVLLVLGFTVACGGKATAAKTTTMPQTGTLTFALSGNWFLLGQNGNDLGMLEINGTYPMHLEVPNGFEKLGGNLSLNFGHTARMSYRVRNTDPAGYGLLLEVSIIEGGIEYPIWP